MLSILIPVYNIDCTPLVNTLINQINGIDKKCEIICIDDASTLSLNNNLLIKETEILTHISLSKNIGRSRIRNKLVQKAKYNWILFLDADTLPKNSNFIEEYIKIIEKNSRQIVVFGGLSYRKKDITDNAYLRYEYGKKRESISAPQRNKRPYKFLLFSNTLIKKSVFKSIQFNNDISEYGHEDSLFSYDLQNHNIDVIHINNTVFHTGLETDKAFIAKTRTGVETLWNLHKQNLIKSNENRLLTVFYKIKTLLLRKIFAHFYSKHHLFMERKLSSTKPSLVLFDFYKLCYLCDVSYN